MHKQLLFAFVFFNLLPAIAKDTISPNLIKPIEKELYQNELVVLVQFKQDTTFEKMLKENPIILQNEFKPESLSVSTNSAVEFILGCVCGLKMGHYLLIVKSITDTLGRPVGTNITEIADVCCTAKSVKKLLGNKIKRYRIFYDKGINHWVIKKKSIN